MPPKEQERQAFRTRFEAAVQRAGTTDSQLAVALGISPQAVYQIKTGDRPGLSHLPDIADKLGVSIEWLRFGDRDKAPGWWIQTMPGSYFEGDVDAMGKPLNPSRVREPHSSVDPTSHSVDIVGRVTAGNGDIDGYEDVVETVEIPQHWKIVVVHGMSAYPVFYPRQLAWVDTKRAARPDTMTEREYIDLHDNVVVVQAEVKGKRVGLLKRFNYQPESPLKFALSSLDAGRSSPYLAPDCIDVILPVVGSWWEDPRQPRRKSYHARSVIVKLIEEGGQ